jgi:hypothetical protein
LKVGAALLTAGGETLTDANEPGPMPCGECLQFLADPAPDELVWVVDLQEAADREEIRRQGVPASVLRVGSQKNVIEKVARERKLDSRWSPET